MMAERIVGLRELGAALQAGGQDAATRRLDRSRPLSAQRRHAGRPPYLSHHPARQVSAVRVLAGDALLRAGAARGRPLLPAARNGREEPDARLVSGRHRAVHADAEQSEQPHGARTQPELPWRDLSLPGEPEDQAAGLLADCGKALPFIDKAVFSREKESIPYWNKFLQGYYDASGISSDSFDQAVRLGVGGDVQPDRRDARQGDRLLTSVRASIFYMGFNMLDPVVGGLSERTRRSCARRCRSPSTRRSSSRSS
jgi:hypothetical protein